MQTRLGFALLVPTVLSMSGLVHGQRYEPLPIMTGEMPTMEIVLRPSGEQNDGGLAGSCEQQVSTHTDADFSGGVYILQGGFAEQEVAAVSYTLPASAFPIEVDMIEMIFGTSNATMSTTTEWSLLVWEGTPAGGILQYEYTSDGKLLPHIELGPGTNGVNLQVSVDPADPEQMYISDNGTQTFSVGFRIDRHNSQTDNPCFVAPPVCCNAFPSTDVGGLHAPTENWIRAVDCGAFGCPDGWNRFSDWPALCRPSGDWVMRATWTPANCGVVGACCLDNGSCVDGVVETDCVGIGGTWAGQDTLCDATNCEPPTEDVPCCFETTGGCIPLSEANCIAAGGSPGPEGATCAEYACFPTGAVCMPNGSCLDGLSPEDAAKIGGTFMGDGTSCATVTCPEPSGGCCFDTGFCLEMTEGNCSTAGGTWAGIGSTCADDDANGTADVCEEELVGDLDGDGFVTGSDLSILLGAWGTNDPIADLNDDDIVDGADLTLLLGNWTG